MLQSRTKVGTSWWSTQFFRGCAQQKLQHSSLCALVFVTAHHIARHSRYRDRDVASALIDEGRPIDRHILTVVKEIREHSQLGPASTTTHGDDTINSPVTAKAETRYLLRSGRLDKTHWLNTGSLNHSVRNLCRVAILGKLKGQDVSNSVDRLADQV